MMETERMVGEAVSMLPKEGIGSFSISTIIPKDWLIREEEAWDMAIEKAQSVKNFLNKKISSDIQKSTGFSYAGDGDCRVVFDYSAGTVQMERNEIFIFGRYKKLAAGLSQSRWLCSGCNGKGCGECNGKGKNYESVEERIGEPARKLTDAEGYVMHASGREDVDATNTAGRPFVLSIKNPGIRNPDLSALRDSIGSGGEVSVSDLTIVPRLFVEVVTESHFDKEYEVHAEFGGEVGDEAIKKIKSLEGKTILQRTPQRVAHRRADLVRHRKIKKVEVSDVNGKRARITIVAEAGTYIKELISGDNGRTEPSISGLLNTKSECKKLVVTRIDDGFLDLCLES